MLQYLDSPAIEALQWRGFRCDSHPPLRREGMLYFLRGYNIILIRNYNTQGFELSSHWPAGIYYTGGITVGIKGRSICFGLCERSFPVTFPHQIIAFSQTLDDHHLYVLLDSGDEYRLNFCSTGYTYSTLIVGDCQSISKYLT
jgi:hypothetical protein